MSQLRVLKSMWRIKHSGKRKIELLISVAFQSAVLNMYTGYLFPKREMKNILQTRSFNRFVFYTFYAFPVNPSSKHVAEFLIRSLVILHKHQASCPH